MRKKKTKIETTPEIRLLNKTTILPYYEFAEDFYCGLLLRLELFVIRDSPKFNLTDSEVEKLEELGLIVIIAYHNNWSLVVTKSFACLKTISHSTF